MHDTGLAANADNVAALVDAWTLMVGRIPGHRLERHDGIAALIGNVPLSFYNFVVLDRPIADLATLDNALALARDHAAACPYEAMLAVCTEWLPPGWQGAFAAAGLRDAVTMTGMAADTVDAPRRPAPPELVLARVDTVALATAVANLNAHAYGQPEADVAFMHNLDLWHPADSFGIVGSVDGRPVTTAAAFVIGDIIYVALVATEPGLHGRGYAEAAMRAAVEQARAAAGPKRIWLHASDAGQPLYASMGFTAGATTPAFALA